jgi:hypothetical protein
MEIDDTIVRIIRELVRIPAALKTWRGPVTELLNDSRVFSSNLDAAVNWKPIIKALFDTDKTAFPELLGKVATAPSANIDHRTFVGFHMFCLLATRTIF